MFDANITNVETYTNAPFDAAVDIYRRAGWQAPLPVDRGHGRAPVPTGFTGGRNFDNYPPSDEQLAHWRVTHGKSNIGLWLPHNVVGIDVDAYGNKTGDQTIKHIEQQIAREPLPPTWTSTCRGANQPSRIHFFRIDGYENARWTTGLTRYGGAVDVIRFGHMFARVWPSRKLDRAPFGETYRWFTPSGMMALHGVVPNVSDLTILPLAWIDAFTVSGSGSGDPRSSTGDRNDSCTSTSPVIGYGTPLDIEASSHWADLLHDAEGDMCVVMREIVDRYNDEMHGSVSRHDTVKSAVWLVLLRAAQHGHRGAKTATDVIYDTFVDVVVHGDNSRSENVAAGEWMRLITGAASRIAYTFPRPDQQRGCDCSRNQSVGQWLSGSRNVRNPRDQNSMMKASTVTPGTIKRVGQVTIAGQHRFTGGTEGVR